MNLRMRYIHRRTHPHKDRGRKNESRSQQVGKQGVIRQGRDIVGRDLVVLPESTDHAKTLPMILLTRRSEVAQGEATTVIVPHIFMIIVLGQDPDTVQCLAKAGSAVRILMERGIVVQILMTSNAIAVIAHYLVEKRGITDMIRKEEEV